MRVILNHYFTPNKILVIFMISWILFSFQDLLAQEPPPNPIQVTVTAQVLSFGAFSNGSAGSVTVTPGGMRSSVNVILLNLNILFSPALFEIAGDNGTLVTIVNGPNVPLTRSGGGYTMNLAIGASIPASPFIITVPPAHIDCYIGGTITVGNTTTNPTGSYSGEFEITFAQN